MDERETFDDTIQLRVPSCLTRAVQRLASRECQPVSAVVRQAIVQRLREAGLEVRPVVAPEQDRAA